MLIGSAMIALGLYLGLRERASTTPLSSSPPPSAGAPHVDRVVPPVAASDPPPSPRTGPADSAATPVSVDAVAKQAATAVEVHRKHLVTTCWAPSAAKIPEPAKVQFVLNLTFDADGLQLTRGISERRGATREGLSQCVQRELPNLKIEPPGRSVAVDVQLEIP